MSVRLKIEPLSIGSRRELFIDDFLLEDCRNLRSELHRPVAREISFAADLPHEQSNASAWGSIVKDGGRYLFYYRAGGRYSSANRTRMNSNWILCLRESSNGIDWHPVDAGIYPEGPNVILTQAAAEALLGPGGKGTHLLAASSVSLDVNPECPQEERFKMLSSDECSKDPRKLYLLVSGDGIRFRPKEGCWPFPIPTAGDSQNTIFFDPESRVYRIYHRIWENGARSFALAESADLKSIAENRPATFSDGRIMQMYTNCVQVYERAPHIKIGFPMRYIENQWDLSVLNRGDLTQRVWRGRAHRRFATASTDTVFLATRNGVDFTRFPEAFIRQGPETRNAWTYYDSSVAYGLTQTPSHLGNGAPDELSLYAVGSYWEDGCSAYRRYTLRLDGFVSLHAGADPGEALTRPFLFAGGNLHLNVETSAFGHIAVEIQDETGQVIPGFALEDCFSGAADSTEMTVRWKQGGDVRKLAGRPVRLRFVLCDGDLYSFRFVPYQADPALPECPETGEPLVI